MSVRRLAVLAVAALALSAPEPAAAQADDSTLGPALKLDGNDAAAFRRRGDKYRETGDADRALADYSEAIGKDPEDLDTRYERGDLFFQLSRFREAVSDYTAVIDKAPDNGPARGNRALALAQLQNQPGPGFRSRSDFDLAVSDFDAAIRLVKRDDAAAQLTFRRGDLLAQRGESARALADFEAAVRLRPENVEFLYRLSHALRDSGDAARAKATLEAAAKLPWDRSWSDEVEKELAALRPPGPPPPPLPSIDNLIIVDANTAVGDDGELKIMIRLDDASAKKLAEFTAENVGRMMAFIAEGETIASAVLAEPIDRGAIQMSTLEGQDDAEQRAARLAKAKSLTLRVER